MVKTFKQFLKESRLLKEMSDDEIMKWLKKNDYLFDHNKYYINNGVVDVNGNVGIINKGLQRIEVKFGKILGSFDCSGNKLLTLENSPTELKLSMGKNGFNCSYNKLTNLKGAPKEIPGSFICRFNNLISLDGCPKEIWGDFDCRNNPRLKSLDGIGKVHGKIYSDF